MTGVGAGYDEGSAGYDEGSAGMTWVGAGVGRAELCCGLCGIIGIGRVELHGRNSSWQVVGPPVSIFSPSDPKHDITR